MGFPSPIQDNTRESPPRPDTPCPRDSSPPRLTQHVQVIIQSFIYDNLKSHIPKKMEEDVRSYQMDRSRKLKISDSVFIKKNLVHRSYRSKILVPTYLHLKYLNSIGLMKLFRNLSSPFQPGSSFSSC